MQHLDVFYVDRPAIGMITLVPHKTQPLSEENLYFLEAYGIRIGSTVVSHAF